MSDHLPPVAPRTAENGTTVYDGISYWLPQGYRPLLLDLHVPAGAADEPVPVVVWIHGGAFWSGDRRYLPDTLEPGSVFSALTDAGLAVATIDYRLSSESPFPAQLDDARAALRYLRTYADQLGIDTGRIGVWGESAGGTLAGLAAYTGDDIAAAVLWYAVSDMTITEPHPDSPETVLLGGTRLEVPDVAAVASPVTHVSAAAPPTLLLHGTSDPFVPALQSERLHAKLLTEGVRSTYVPVPDAGHCFTDHPDVPGLIATSVAFLAGELLA